MGIRVFKSGILANIKNGLIAHRHSDYVAVQVLEEWYHPVAITADYILTTTAMPTATSGVDITTFAHQPDFPRNVTAVASAAQTAHLIVYGTNIKGEAISEELTLNGTTAVVGAKAFATITKIHLNERSGAANVTVGVGNKLGLLVKPRAFATEALVDEVLEGTPATIVIASSTAAFNTALDPAKVYTLKYWASEIK